MKRFLFLLLAACGFFSVSVEAQWTNLGQFSPLVMTGDYKGVAVTNTSGSTPAQGSTWKVYASNDDWVTRTQRSAGGGTDYGCCTMTKLSAVSEDTIFAAHYFQGFGKILKTTDRCNFWQEFNPNQINLPISDLQALNENEVYVIGENYNMTATIALRITAQSIDTLFIGADNGQNARIYFVNSLLGFISTFDSLGIVRLHRTDDGGTTWTNPLSIGVGNHLAIEFADNINGYAGGSNGTFYKTTDAGQTWNILSINGPVHTNEIEFLSVDTGFVASRNGLMMRTFDAGQTWTSEVVDSAANLIYLKVIDSDIIYAQKDDYTLFKRNYIASSEDFQSQLELVKVYPQPTNGMLFLHIPDGIILKQYWLYGMDGRLLENGIAKSIDLSLYPAGVYHLQLETNKGRVNKKIIHSK